jgi:hypothetical protein
MIEFSQPAQCLFCPQRRKIALLLKLVMAGSAAIITAIILFQPGAKRAATQKATPPSQSVGASSTRNVQVMVEGETAERTGASDAVSKRSAEIRAEAKERFEDVQSQIRPLLSEKVPAVAKAQNLLDERRREVLKSKVLTLGEGLFSGSVAAEAERKLVVEALDREISILAEQKKLLNELKSSD